MTFTKYRDTLTYSIPNVSLKSIGENTIVVSVFPEDMTQDVKPENNAFTLGYDSWKNEDMKVAWSEIKNRPQVTVTIDLFWLGLVYFRKGQAKEHFKLKF